MATYDKERIEQSHSQNKKQLTLVEVMQSIMAAAFGVQSSRKRDLDITHGKPSTFILAGLIFVLLFILILVGLVKIILTLFASG